MLDSLDNNDWHFGMNQYSMECKRMASICLNEREDDGKWIRLDLMVL